jgi:lipoprotein-releasing system permease protein
VLFLKLAGRYLLPQKKSLSSALISTVSLLIVTLVVWLVLVFLSVTTGIEKNWLKKLTSLHAPVRITPTEAYYNSYYHQIDKYASYSQYTYKTIGEKALCSLTDPYNDRVDVELPQDIAYQTDKRDLVKDTYKILNTNKSIVYQDYELAGALLKLNLDQKRSPGSFLSQMSYLLSIPDKNPDLVNLLLTPSLEDINQVFSHLDLATKDQIQNFFDCVTINKVQSPTHWKIDTKLLNSNHEYLAWAAMDHETIHSIVLPNQNTPKFPLMNFSSGKLVFEGKWFFQNYENQKKYALNEFIPIKVEEEISFDVTLDQKDIASTTSFNDLSCQIQGLLQNKPISGKTLFSNLTISSYELNKKPSLFWAYVQDNKVILPKTANLTPVLIAKSVKNQGINIGDQGYLSYSTFGVLANQEKRIPITVVGFYDPGFLPVGNRFIFVPNDITKTISSSQASIIPDHTPTNGIFVWFKDLNDTKKIKQKIEEQLKEAKLLPYWKVETFHDYEFSKDLMEQFSSDRTLFTLVALIILLVACSNIVSSLILLVHDKKKEIAVLQAIGATKKQIILLFGFCGFIMGLFSAVLGIIAAYFTLHHIDGVAQILSWIQGHTAFHAAFFGEHLPNTLSESSVLFILIATPLLSLIAGLIPAWKSMKVSPSSELRSNI